MVLPFTKYCRDYPVSFWLPKSWSEFKAELHAKRNIFVKVLNLSILLFCILTIIVYVIPCAYFDYYIGKDGIRRIRKEG